jgi:hypothetical protein
MWRQLGCYRRHRHGEAAVGAARGLHCQKAAQQRSLTKAWASLLLLCQRHGSGAQQMVGLVHNLCSASGGSSKNTERIKLEVPKELYQRTQLQAQAGLDWFCSGAAAYCRYSMLCAIVCVHAMCLLLCAPMPGTTIITSVHNRSAASVPHRGQWYLHQMPH